MAFAWQPLALERAQRFAAVDDSLVERTGQDTLMRLLGIEPVSLTRGCPSQRL